MLKPNGYPAKNIDPVMLLYLWARHLDEREPLGSKSFIYAGIGRPTYLLNEDLVFGAVDYWQGLLLKLNEVKEKFSQSDLSLAERCEVIVGAKTAINYGWPAGEEELRGVMAAAFSDWYRVPVTADDLIFSVGGLGALAIIFQMLRDRGPEGGKIVTPCPYYPYYNNSLHHHQLHFIDVMGERGYRLTARALERSLQGLAESASEISAFLFCDPNNPLGYVVGRDEWREIVGILKKTEKTIPIVVDEAYAELVFEGKHHSLLEVAPELKERLIVIRSATKGFSASGERMGIILCFNGEWREDLITKTILTYVHAPISLQTAYTRAMKAFTEEKGKELAEFYRMQVAFVDGQLKKMGTAVADPDYIVEGSFYILANLKALFGREIPSSAAKVLGRGGVIETDVEICYSLLFEERVMVAPFSFFGGDPSLGYVRITCSGGIAELTELLSRIGHPK